MKLTQVLNSNLGALRASLKGVGAGGFDTPETEHYCWVLIAYLSGNIPDLIRLIKKAESLSPGSESFTTIALLARLRLQLLLRAVDPILVSRLEAHGKGPWKGEVQFVLGNAAVELGQYSRARDYFVRAVQRLQDQGIRDKAARAFLSARSAEARMGRPLRISFFRRVSASNGAVSIFAGSR